MDQWNLFEPSSDMNLYGYGSGSSRFSSSSSLQNRSSLNGFYDSSSRVVGHGRGSQPPTQPPSPSPFMSSSSNRSPLGGNSSPTFMNMGSSSQTGFGSSSGSGFGNNSGSGYINSSGSAFGNTPGSGGFGCASGTGFGSSSGSGFGNTSSSFGNSAGSGSGFGNSTGSSSGSSGGSSFGNSTASGFRNSGSSQPYGNCNGMPQAVYGSSASCYGNSTGISNSTYSNPSYGNNSVSSQSGYGNNSGSSQSGYGNNSGSSQSGYGNNSGSSQSGYGNNSGSSQSGYGNNSGSSGFGNNSGSSQSGYGNNSGSSSSYGNNSGPSGYGNNSVSSISSGYGNCSGNSSMQSGYVNNSGPSQSSFGNSVPQVGPRGHTLNPRYDQINSYDNFGSSSLTNNGVRSNLSNRGGQTSPQSRFFNTEGGGAQGNSGPPVPDFQIGTFMLNSNGVPIESSGNEASNSSYTSTSNGNGHSGSQSSRETGIIEKLLQTYGFIQCCERQARLFFHFSQFDGNTEHLRIGDPVEFEVTFDRRTGKPIASSVSKISPEVVLSEERVVGLVTTELRCQETGVEQQGRISYENRGECFFLPYGKDDVEGYVTLKPGDRVGFQIATNQRYYHRYVPLLSPSRTGNLTARHVRLENPAQPVTYQGVVSVIKDTYAFVERADVVDEIFFQLADVAHIAGGLKPGDDIEFHIQTRVPDALHPGKELAVDVVKLPPGTVVFEDTCSEVVKGQVLKPVEKRVRSGQKDAALTGRIRFRGKDRSEVEVKFGERDQKGDFSLRHGDWVQFNIATDRRDHLQKATNISLLDESFAVSGEKREQGIVASLSDGFGFLRCVERENLMYFPCSELLEPDREIIVGDEVEFTMAQLPDPSSQPPVNRQTAIRIHHLASGTVKFEVLLQEGIYGEVLVEAPPPPVSPPCESISSTPSPIPREAGLISYQMDGVTHNISYYATGNVADWKPKLGDKLRFNAYQIKSSKEIVARDFMDAPSPQADPPTPDRAPSPVAFTQTPPPSAPLTPQTTTISPPKVISTNGKNGSNNKQSSQHQGFIAALKDTFGFIETLAHDREIFFHFSNVDGDAGTFELGQEVSYTLPSRPGPGGKVSADNVRALPKGTIVCPKIHPKKYEGVIVRSMRAVNPDQLEYNGLVSVGREFDSGENHHEFGITGVINKRELLQPGDQVTFQLDEEEMAVNVSAVRKKIIATVDAVKGQYGFLNYETEEGKKLFFHQTEVKDGIALSPGDDVEFVVITNQKTGKSSACNISRIMSSNGPSQRPDRLISKLKSLHMETTGPRITVLRQPRGPDGTKGFKPRSTLTVFT